MSDDEHVPPSERGELLELAGCLVGVITLLGTCIMLPLLAAGFIHPILGIVLAVAAFVAWARWGPPPMPGFANGIICLWGFGAIIGTLIACIGLTIRAFAS